jgi:hypothetical protein
VPPDAIARHVGANVEVFAERRQARIARLGRAQEGTGLRVELAETEEVVSQILRQDGQIRLHETRRDAGGGAAVLTAADRPARLGAARVGTRGARFGRPVHRDASLAAERSLWHHARPDHVQSGVRIGTHKKY